MIIQQRLRAFKSHLKEEEALSKKFYQQRNEVLDVFDLNDGDLLKGDDNDTPLLENLPQANPYPHQELSLGESDSASYEKVIV